MLLSAVYVPAYLEYENAGFDFGWKRPVLVVLVLSFPGVRHIMVFCLVSAGGNRPQ